MDGLKVVFEAIDDFADGCIERTRFEKDTTVDNDYERGIDKLIDLYSDFLQVYGFTHKTIVSAMKEYVEYDDKE